MSKTNLTPANAYTYGGNLAMSLPDNPICTAEDYWNLPEGERAELMVSFMHWLHPAESIRKLSLSSPTIFNITSNLTKVTVKFMLLLLLSI